MKAQLGVVAQLLLVDKEALVGSPTKNYSALPNSPICSKAKILKPGGTIVNYCILRSGFAMHCMIAKGKKKKRKSQPK